MALTPQRVRYAVAAVAGLLLALSFPKPSVAGFAWIAPGLLLFAAGGTAAKTLFRLGFVGGFVHYLASLYWLLHIPVKFLPILGWIALSAYLSLFMGAWVWLCWKFSPAPSTRLLATKWIQRALWAIWCAVAWVCIEMIVGRFLSGFPWDFLGVSQYRIIPLIQITEFTGVYGISFLVVWFSVSLGVTGLALTQKPGTRIHWLREIALPLATLVLLSVWGMGKLRSAARPEDTVLMALIQPSIPQTLIWDDTGDSNRFQQLLELSRTALTNNPDILVWPEASVPNMLRHNRETAEAIVGLAKDHRVWVILGSDDAEIRDLSGEKPLVDYYNSAFAISPDGELSGTYRKRRLVIFGEYVPFVKWLPFMKILSPAGESGFKPGDKPVPFFLNSLAVTASVLICFEDTFPHIAREYVTRTTDFLVNLTNNGWFGESAAQWQHAATAVFRAIENRIPLVRCANNGLTCWVDQFGVVYDTYFPESNDIYKAGYKLVNIPVLRAGERRQLTFYTRYGDVFGWSCFAFTFLRLAPSTLKKLRQRKTAPPTS